MKVTGVLTMMSLSPWPFIGRRSTARLKEAKRFLPETLRKKLPGQSQTENCSSEEEDP